LANAEVLPLLFDWQDVTASELKSLMRITNNDDMPLYMARLLDILRKVQSNGKMIFGELKSIA